MRRPTALIRVVTATAAVVTAAGLTATAPALAEITSSAITVPADGLRFQVTDDNLEATIPVAGTSGGGAPADALPLTCFVRPGKATVLGTGTVQDGSGAFTGSISPASQRGPCVLRALPGAFDPTLGDPSPFDGPLLTVEAQRTVKVPGGPNAGTVIDTDDWLQQSAAGVGLCSLGSSGFCGTRLFDGASRRSTEPVFNAGGWTGATTGTRAGLQVDGTNAYAPFRAAQINADAPGLPAVTRTTTRDPGTGTASVAEADPLVSCNTQAFPPGEACTAFATVGVRFERTTTVSADGATVTQRDVLVSTDGKAHRVSAHVGQNFLIDANTSPSIRFGWVAGDAGGARTTGTTVNGPASGPATIFVGSNAAAGDGDPVFAQGAVTFDRPPASVRVAAPTDLLVRLHDVTVPAGGRADLVTSTYVTARTRAEVAASVTPREDAAVKPTVAFTSPKPGAIVLTPTITVTGTTSDNVGVRSLVVGGRTVTPRADGRFSVSLPVTKGPNTITAVSSDGAGNTATATLKLTYQDRLPPAVGRLFVAPAIWRAGRTTRVGFTLGEAGTMRLTASRPLGGRKTEAGTCVASTPALKRARARVCRRYVVLATSVEPKRPGVVRVLIGPKLGGRTMKPGRVRLAVTVTDYARNVSKASFQDILIRKALPGRG